MGVTDGDSIRMLHEGRQERVRPHGTDCPEKGQDFETKAKHTTSLLVFAKVVDVQPVPRDRYGRRVASVRVCNTLVSEELIRQGVTWVFTRYCHRAICEEWQVLEAEAQEKRRGLCSMPNTIPPWEFRRSAG